MLNSWECPKMSIFFNYWLLICSIFAFGFLAFSTYTCMSWRCIIKYFKIRLISDSFLLSFLLFFFSFPSPWLINYFMSLDYCNSKFILLSLFYLIKLFMFPWLSFDKFFWLFLNYILSKIKKRSNAIEFRNNDF